MSLCAYAHFNHSLLLCIIIFSVKHLFSATFFCNILIALIVIESFSDIVLMTEWPDIDANLSPPSNNNVLYCSYTLCQ